MPRVIKHPDLRRLEILDWAQRVFLSRGYENSSLNDVIAEAGLSKGVFYHYYSSKEQLLEALAGRFAQGAYDAVHEVLHDSTLGPLARLKAFVQQSWQHRLAVAPIQWRLFEALYRPENLALHERITLASAALFRPALTKIIVEGIEKGDFDTFDAEGVADLLLNLPASTYPILAQLITASDNTRVDEIVHTLQRRLRLYGIAIDRVLGLPDGSVPLANIDYVRTLVSSRQSSRTPEGQRARTSPPKSPRRAR